MSCAFASNLASNLTFVASLLMNMAAESKLVAHANGLFSSAARVAEPLYELSKSVLAKLIIVLL